MLELPNLTFTDADVLDDLPRLCVSNASVSCDVAHSLVLADRKIKGLHLILTDSDEPAVALSALRNLPAISAVSLTTSSMATGAWDPFLFVLKNARRPATAAPSPALPRLSLALGPRPGRCIARPPLESPRPCLPPLPRPSDRGQAPRHFPRALPIISSLPPRPPHASHCRVPPPLRCPCSPSPSAPPLPDPPSSLTALNLLPPLLNHPRHPQDIEQPWPARLNDAITESRLLQTVRLELSSSALVSSGGHAVSLLRLLASGGHVRSVSLAIKLPDLRPDVLSALLAEVAGSPKVHDVAVHLTGPECALTAMAHVAAGGLGHVQHWELALAFAEGAAEAAVALVPVCAVAGVQAATLLVRGPGGTVPDGACAQLAALLARERGVAVKLGCRATAAGREALDKAGTLVRDPAE